MSHESESAIGAGGARAEPSSWNVRRATPADLDDLVAFNAAMARETEGRELDAARLRAGIGRALADEERGVYWVCADARDHGRESAAGALLVTREWSDWRDGWFWWIQSVYVRPEARRRGVYRALWEHVLGEARAAGDVRGLRLYVERENAGARAVYERLGMRVARYALYEIDGVPAAPEARP